MASPIELATFLDLGLASPTGLATLPSSDWPFPKGLETGLNQEVVGNGQSNWTGHFSQFELYLQRSGQSNRTGHFITNEMASPMGLAILK